MVGTPENFRPDAMESYENAVRAEHVVVFDVTQIDRLGITDEEKPVDFEYLRKMPEAQRLALLEGVTHSNAINWGMPHGVTWETESKDLPPVRKSAASPDSGIIY